MSWRVALQTAAADSTGNYQDWRVPNVKQLYSIVENRCENPAINLNVFADGENGYYWTSTAGYVTSGTQVNAKRVNFATGVVETSSFSSENISTNYGRLVRGGY
jgi:hypothetical protein